MRPMCIILPTFNTIKKVWYLHNNSIRTPLAPLYNKEGDIVSGFQTKTFGNDILGITAGGSVLMFRPDALCVMQAIEFAIE